MSWNTDLSIKRIYNVFKRSKITIYPEDTNALNNVLETIKELEKGFITDHLLFSKLVTVMLIHNLRFCKDIKTAIKYLDSDLKTPLVDHIEFLRIELNNNDLSTYFESLGVDFNNINSQNEKIKGKENELIEKISKFWDYQKVENSIVKTTNEFLKDVSNYKL